MPLRRVRPFLFSLLLSGAAGLAPSAGAGPAAIQYELLRPVADSAPVPSGKRVPAGWLAFAVGESPVVLRCPEARDLAPGAGYALRLTTALDDRETRLVEVTVAATGRPLGRLDLRFAHALETFQLPLTPAQASEVSASGVALRLAGGGAPRSSRALIIGVSVKETRRLTSTAAAAVMPN